MAATMTCYTLSDDCPVPWNETQESQLHHDYPFVGQPDTDETFVIRNYLENLWLPESITSPESLIHTLRRFQSSIPSSSDASAVHPMHRLLDTVLLRSRNASDKYRTELVQILADGGGAGELEESMMWFAWNYEKVPAAADADSEDGEERWKRCWLDRLEQKETKIQILLYLFKLSLPGACPPPGIDEDPTQEAGESPSSSSPSRRHKKSKKKKKKKGESPPPESIEERLESFMDKLSMWQLTATIDAWASGVVPNGSSAGDASTSSVVKAKASADERDWTQAFCEDVVEPLFKERLPEQCALLRSKLFPTSPFSDAEDFSDLEGTTTVKAKSRTNSRAPSAGGRSLRGISPLPSEGGRSAAATRSRAGSREPDGNSAFVQQRARSRSLSVSLAQDEESKKHMLFEPRRGKQLSREISMSRLLKAKDKHEDDHRNVFRRETSKTTTINAKTSESQGVTLVAATPVKRQRSMTVHSAHDPYDTSSSCFNPEGGNPLLYSSPSTSTVILDTPVKATKNQAKIDVFELSPLSPLPETPIRNKGKSKATNSSKLRKFSPASEGDQWLDENADESFTSSFGSPDVLLLSSDDDHSGLDKIGAIDLSPSTGKSRKGSGLESPTKRRRLGSLKFKSNSKGKGRSCSPEL